MKIIEKVKKLKKNDLISLGFSWRIDFRGCPKKEILSDILKGLQKDNLHSRTNLNIATKKWFKKKKKTLSLKAKGLCPIHKHKMDVRILDYTKNKTKPVITYHCYECRDELISNRAKQRLIDERKSRMARERRIKDVKEYKKMWDKKCKEKNVLPNKIKK